VLLINLPIEDDYVYCSFKVHFEPFGIITINVLTLSKTDPVTSRLTYLREDSAFATLQIITSVSQGSQQLIKESSEHEAWA